MWNMFEYPQGKVEEVSLLARNNSLFGRVPVSDGVLEQ